VRARARERESARARERESARERERATARESEQEREKEIEIEREREIERASETSMFCNLCVCLGQREIEQSRSHEREKPIDRVVVKK